MDDKQAMQQGTPPLFGPAWFAALMWAAAHAEKAQAERYMPRSRKRREHHNNAIRAAKMARRAEALAR
jgi:hypothetical protein